MTALLDARANIAALRQTLATEESPTTHPEEALRNLFWQQGNDEKRMIWLQVLGATKRRVSRAEQRKISYMHEELANAYQERGKEHETAEIVLRNLLEVEDAKRRLFILENLFAHGQHGITILHVILDRSTYEPKGGFHFDRVKPLIRFLLHVHPRLPAVVSTERMGPPIFIAVQNKQTTIVGVGDIEEAVFSPPEKEAIVQFLCEKQNGDVASKAAIESMTLMGPLSHDNSSACHAIHRVIESSDFAVPEHVVRELSKIEVIREQWSSSRISCLEICDDQGRTCLHIALTAPFNERKVWWSQKLAELRPDLLKTIYKTTRSGKEEQLTPLQYFMEQMMIRKQEPRRDDQNFNALDEKLEHLEAFLKRQCLANFDNFTCKSIMYKKKNGEPFKSNLQR